MLIMGIFIAITCVSRPWTTQSHISSGTLSLDSQKIFALNSCLLLYLLSCFVKEQFWKLLCDHNWSEPIKASLLLSDGIFSFDLLILTVDDWCGAKFQILLHDVGAWVEIGNCKGLRYVAQGWSCYLTSSEFHLLASGVKSLKEGLIVVMSAKLTCIGMLLVPGL